MPLSITAPSHARARGSVCVRGYHVVVGRARSPYRARSPPGATPSGDLDDLDDLDDPSYDAWCAQAFVTVDNATSPDYTLVKLEMLDYKGLMAVISWCLNGLDVVAEYAEIKTIQEDNGNGRPVAMNSFWLRTVSGRKLSDAKAESLRERLQDYVAYCSPKPEDASITSWESECGHIRISNGDHERYTVVTIEENARTPGQMLSIASILTGLNARVVEGSIQSPEATGRTGRLFSFCIAREDGSAGHGGKFDGRSCSAMLYALGIGLGLTSQRFPLKPPVGS